MEEELNTVIDSYKLFAGQLKEVRKYQKKLEKAFAEYNAAVGSLVDQATETEMLLDGLLLQSDEAAQQLLDATKQMQETQVSFNLQYLQLQSQMQHENRSYTAVSNIMKTKHDTVKNSISNIR